MLSLSIAGAKVDVFFKIAKNNTIFFRKFFNGILLNQ